MGNPKPFYASRTTQNVAGAGVAGGGVAMGALAVVRANAPGLLPWDESADVAVLSVVTMVIVPLLSRLIAFWRTPKKAG